MESKAVIAALSALAHETRLALFRRLVQAGQRGLAAGVLADELGVAPPTLSFHLKELRNAGLVTRARDGRSIRYAPDFGAIARVVAYLGENCCQEEAGCEPARGGSSCVSSSP